MTCYCILFLDDSEDHSIKPTETLVQKWIQGLKNEPLCGAVADIIDDYCELVKSAWLNIQNYVYLYILQIMNTY